MRAKFINENIKDIFKPKTEEEIQKNIRKLSGDRIMNLISGQPHIDIKLLKIALEKGIDLDNYDLESIVADLDRNGQYDNKILLPSILKDFPYDVHKTKNGYFIIVKWWDSFSKLFKENRDLDLITIDKILSGNSDDLFYHISIEDIDLVDYEWAISQFKENDIDLKQLKDLTLKEANRNDIEILTELNNLEEIFKFISENEDSLYDLSKAIKRAIIETEQIANEDEAFKDLKNAILKYFKWEEPIIKEGQLKIPVTSDQILLIYKIYHDIMDGINYSIPYNGWQGDFKKYGQVFGDALMNYYKEEKIDESVKLKL